MAGSKALENKKVGCVTSEAIDGLGSTVGNFASRMKRKLKEQESKQEESVKQAENRHSRMLQAMTTIRRALQETCKIKLGNRFSLDLDITDWEGWPRLELCLVDALVPENRDHSLIVSAHDRKESGTVNLTLRNGRVLGHVELQEANQMERIPLVLKKSVRTYLDIVAEYVLNPVKQTEILVKDTAPLEVEEPDDSSKKLAGENLFVDDDYCRDDENRVQVDDQVASVEGPSFE